MSKITIIIPPQSFEFIRDRIANILIDEIQNQYVLTSDPSINALVSLENRVPNDKTEMPEIVVSVAKGEYGNKFQGTTRVAYSFNIDVFTNAKTNATINGDLLAVKRCHRLTGICRYILEDPQYKTLGFTPPFIVRTSYQDMNIADPAKMDADNTVMARLVFVVEVMENTTLIVPDLIAGYQTKNKIEDTDQGYFSTT
jgi:hypothetical protein